MLRETYENPEPTPVVAHTMVSGDEAAVRAYVDPVNETLTPGSYEPATSTQGQCEAVRFTG